MVPVDRAVDRGRVAVPVDLVDRDRAGDLAALVAEDPVPVAHVRADLIEVLVEEHRKKTV